MFSSVLNVDSLRRLLDAASLQVEDRSILVEDLHVAADVMDACGLTCHGNAKALCPLGLTVVNGDVDVTIACILTSNSLQFSTIDRGREQVTSCSYRIGWCYLVVIAVLSIEANLSRTLPFASARAFFQVCALNFSVPVLRKL